MITQAGKSKAPNALLGPILGRADRRRTDQERLRDAEPELLKVSACKVTLGFIVTLMAKTLQRLDIWRRGSVCHLCGALEGITAHLKKKKKVRGGPESRGSVST